MNIGIVVAVCYYVVFAAQFWVMWQERNPKENEIFAVTIPNAVMEKEEIASVRNRYTRMLGGMAVLLAAVPAVLMMLSWLTVQILVWMILFILLAVLSYFPYWMANKAVRQLKEQNRYMEGVSLAEVDDFWKYGIFYHNPQDERLIVEKKIGVGTCVNHARPFGKFLTGLACTAIIALLVFGVYLVNVQSAPLTLSYEDGVLKSGQTRTNYSLDADVIQMIMFLDEVPKDSKIIGMGLDNLQRGVYEVEGFGRCKLNLNPQNQAFILIQAEDGCYIFSAATDEKTSEIYQKLKGEL